MGERLRELALKLPKFIASNILGTIVDLTVLFLLSEFLFSTYAGEYIAAPVISFECAVCVNYLSSSFFVWKDRIRGKKLKYFLRRYILYNLSASGTFLVKMSLLLLFEAIFGWNVIFCNIAALCISGLINFSMGEWVIFRKRKV